MDRSKTGSSVAQFIAQAIEASGKTNEQIATSLGYQPERAQMVVMFAEGKAKLPINKIVALAHAVGVDPAVAMEIVISEYSPDVWRLVEEVIVRKVVITDNEHAILNEMRKLAHSKDPALRTPEQHRALAAFVSSMVDAPEGSASQARSK